MKKSEAIKTALLLALFLLLVLQKGYGFLLILLLPFFLLYLIWNAVRMIRRAGERRVRGIRLALWSAAFVLAVTVQGYWSVAVRNQADLALEKVLAYWEKTGVYPVRPGEAGLNEADLQKNWDLRYFLAEGAPRFAYPHPFLPLTLYEYDFEHFEWRRNAY